MTENFITGISITNCLGIKSLFYTKKNELNHICYLSDLEKMNLKQSKSIAIVLEPYSSKTYNQEIKTLNFLTTINLQNKCIIFFPPDSELILLKAFKMGYNTFLSIDNSNIEKLRAKHKDNLPEPISISSSNFPSNILRNNSLNRVVFQINKKEKEIISYLWKGKGNKEISMIMGYSERTIERYRSEMLKKTNSINIIVLIKKLLLSGDLILSE